MSDQDLLRFRTEAVTQWEIERGLHISRLQLSIALAKLYHGYAPGDEGWSVEDQQAIEFVLRFFEKPKEEAPSNVVPLGGLTSLDIPPDRVLQSSIGKMKNVVVLGYMLDGDEWYASSIADGGTVMWLLERCKKKLLDW